MGANFKFGDFAPGKRTIGSVLVNVGDDRSGGKRKTRAWKRGRNKN
jgi:hypothetical protein